MTRASILVGALALAFALVATAVAAPRVYYETPFGEVVSKPKRIEFSDLTLTKIHWRHWGRKTSRGSGRVRINTCDPSCGQGTIVRGSVRLKMFKRHDESGKRFYGCMTGTTTAGGETNRVEWPPGCAG